MGDQSRNRTIEQSHQSNNRGTEELRNRGIEEPRNRTIEQSHQSNNRGTEESNNRTIASIEKSHQSNNRINRTIASIEQSHQSNNRINRKIGSIKKNSWRRILSDFLSLGLLKATDALVLILLIPYIVSRVGIVNYGVLAFVMVFLNTGKNVVEYGFQVSGVRLVALARERQEDLSGLFWQVLYTRLVLCLAFILFIGIAVQLIPYLKEREWVFYPGLLLPLGHILFADWFFIAVQQARWIAIANLGMKLLYVLLVVVFVRTPDDFILIPAMQGAASLAAGCWIVYAAARRYRLGWSPPDRQRILGFIRSDFRLWLSNLAVEFNTSYSILILNILTTDSLTGYFQVMNKLAQPLRFLLVIFSQAVFPVVCRKAGEGWGAAVQFIKRAWLIFCGPALGAVVLIAICAAPLLSFFAGRSDVFLVGNFRIFLLVPVIVLLNIPATQLLLAYERKSAYTAVFLLAMAVKAGLDFLLIRYAGLRGLMYSCLIVEGGILLGLWWAVSVSLPSAQTGDGHQGLKDPGMS